eukprot:PhM_4_TR16079/c6_g1_i1/m.94325
MSTEPPSCTCVLWLSVRRALGLGERDSFEPWSTCVASALRRFEPSFQEPTTFPAFRVRESVLAWLREHNEVDRRALLHCISCEASQYNLCRQCKVPDADVTNVDRWCLYAPRGIYEAVRKFFLRFDRISTHPLASQLSEWVEEDLAGLVDVMFTMYGSPLLHLLRFMDGSLQRAMYKLIVVTEGQSIADAYRHECRSYDPQLTDWRRAYHVVGARHALAAAQSVPSAPSTGQCPLQSSAVCEPSSPPSAAGQGSQRSSVVRGQRPEPPSPPSVVGQGSRRSSAVREQSSQPSPSSAAGQGSQRSSVVRGQRPEPPSPPSVVGQGSRRSSAVREQSSQPSPSSAAGGSQRSSVVRGQRPEPPSP